MPKSELEWLGNATVDVAKRVGGHLSDAWRSLTGQDEKPPHDRRSRKQRRIRNNCYGGRRANQIVVQVIVSDS